MSEKTLSGGDELFFHPDVLTFYYSVIEEWKSEKKIALLLGCTKHKPYSRSFMHKKVIGMLRKHSLDSKVQEYIIGEPLIAVPREWETKYPATHYDFPPEKMTESGRKVFINRLNLFFKKAVKMHNFFIVFAPNHHKRIILESIDGLAHPIVVSYNVYRLPVLLEILKEVAHEI
uniref:DUF5591 domain-containing protein n=2 Tax=cellular organisms TaxID=131567 RepID=A0A7C3RD32_ARCFL